jgi:hypothetical protein
MGSAQERAALIPDQAVLNVLAGPTTIESDPLSSHGVTSITSPAAEEPNPTIYQV